MDTDLVFKKVFDSLQKELVFTTSEYSLASYVCKVARKEIPLSPFQSNKKNIEGVEEKFVRIAQLFKISSAAKNTFLEYFERWSALRKKNVRSLKKIAEEIKTDKFNSDIAKVVGGVVGALGGVAVGLSFLTPLAVVTLPLAIGGGVASAVGGGVVVGTAGTEIVLLKKKLEEAKVLIMQEEASFSTIAQWFSHTEELKEAIKSLVGYSLFKSMAEYLKDFQVEVKDLVNFTENNLNIRFKSALERCIKVMCNTSKIMNEFGVVVAPVVMSFVIVLCLLRYRNRIVIDCILQTDRLLINMMSMMDIGVEAGQLVAGIAAKGAVAVGKVSIARIAVMGTFVAAAIVVDVINVVLSSIDIHKRPVPEHAKKINDAAIKLQREFDFIESVYDELKNFTSAVPSDVIDWKTFMILHVPEDAEEEDITMVVKSYLPNDVQNCIQLKRLSTAGNNWEVKIPTLHSERLLKQPKLLIKKDLCIIIQ